MNVFIACPCGFATSTMAAQLFRRACPDYLSCEITHGTDQHVPKDVDLIIYQEGTTIITHQTAMVRSVKHLLSLTEYRQIVEEWVNGHET